MRVPLLLGLMLVMATFPAATAETDATEESEHPTTEGPEQASVEAPALPTFEPSELPPMEAPILPAGAPDASTNAVAGQVGPATDAIDNLPPALPGPDAVTVLEQLSEADLAHIHEVLRTLGMCDNAQDCQAWLQACVTNVFPCLTGGFCIGFKVEGPVNPNVQHLIASVGDGQIPGREFTVGRNEDTGKFVMQVGGQLGRGNITVSGSATPTGC